MFVPARGGRRAYLRRLANPHRYRAGSESAIVQASEHEPSRIRHVAGALGMQSLAALPCMTRSAAYRMAAVSPLRPLCPARSLC